MKPIYRILTISWLAIVGWIIYVDIDFLVKHRQTDNNKFGLLVIAAVYLIGYLVGSAYLLGKKWHSVSKERKQTLLVTRKGKIVVMEKQKV